MKQLFMVTKIITFIGVFFLISSGALASELTQESGEQLVVSKGALDKLFVLLCAGMVFLMQAGFKCFEVGIVRSKNATATGMKNIIDWIVCSLIFFCLGFGFMFGKSAAGVIGTNFFFLKDVSEVGLGSVFFMFQLAFAGTALTIVSGAMSERTGFISYLFGSFCIALLIYPIFGHWAWGNLFLSDNQAWLADLGFIDFAGSTVVHSIGAWVALVGVWFVGPRLGRYDENGKLRPFESHSYAYAVLGVIILWFGWWGFNGGSELAVSQAVGPIIVNTNLAAAASGLTAFFHCLLFQKRENIKDKLLGGVLGGLVAITACCSVVGYVGAICVGLLAGIVHNLSFDLLAKTLKLDDPVGAIPVHGFCGALGTVCVAIFGKSDLLPNPRLIQLGVQLLGVVVAFVWASLAALIMYKILHLVVGLRVSPAEEQAGLDIASEFVSESNDGGDGSSEGPSEEELRKIMGM